MEALQPWVFEQRIFEMSSEEAAEWSKAMQSAGFKAGPLFLRPCEQGLGFWVLGLGFRVLGLGFRVYQLLQGSIYPGPKL